MKILRRRKLNEADLIAFSGISEETEAKRAVRENILAAFDIYKTNVYYGVITETAAEHAAILVWYKQLCDLQDGAFENIPANIKKYLRR